MAVIRVKSHSVVTDAGQPQSVDHRKVVTVVQALLKPIEGIKYSIMFFLVNGLFSSEPRLVNAVIDIVINPLIDCVDLVLQGIGIKVERVTRKWVNDELKTWDFRALIVNNAIGLLVPKTGTVTRLIIRIGLKIDLIHVVSAV